MMRWIACLALVVLAWSLSGGVAGAAEWWMPNLCLARSFGPSGFAVSEFRTTTTGCSFEFEDALRGTIRTQVSQWLLGFKLDLALVSKLVETFGGRSKNAEGLEIRGALPDRSPSMHRSFFIKASRKNLLLGFSLEW